jgi:hypothetical protein
VLKGHTGIRSQIAVARAINVLPGVDEAASGLVPHHDAFDVTGGGMDLVNHRVEQKPHARLQARARGSQLERLWLDGRDHTHEIPATLHAHVPDTPTVPLDAINQLLGNASDDAHPFSPRVGVKDVEKAVQPGRAGDSHATQPPGFFDQQCISAVASCRDRCRYTCHPASGDQHIYRPISPFIHN